MPFEVVHLRSVYSFRTFRTVWQYNQAKYTDKVTKGCFKSPAHYELVTSFTAEDQTEGKKCPKQEVKMAAVQACQSSPRKLPKVSILCLTKQLTANIKVKTVFRLFNCPVNLEKSYSSLHWM